MELPPNSTTGRVEILCRHLCQVYHEYLLLCDLISLWPGTSRKEWWHYQSQPKKMGVSIEIIYKNEYPTEAPWET